MNKYTAKSLLIQLQCTNKEITEDQNAALSYVVSLLDDLSEQYDRGNYGIEKKMIKKAYPDYSDKEVEAYIRGYEEKGLEVYNRVMEDKATRVGCLKLMPTEVDGLYLNVLECLERGLNEE